MKPINITIENIDHLNADDATVVRCIASTGWFNSLDQFAAECRGWLGRDWLVYQGGSHVAIHRTSGDDRRVLIAS